MNANKGNLMSILSSEYAQLKIPVYQRTYDWDVKHCQKLVEDVFHAMENKQEHFTGSIVYLNEKEFFQEKTSLIIDGQQRIMTVMIILRALSNIAQKLNHILMHNNIEEKNLNLLSSDFKKLPRLIPTEEDQDQFDLFITNQIEKMHPESGILMNYQIIYNLLEKRLLTVEDLNAFYSTLNNNMTIVEIVLDEGRDDPQEIFESINSTGLELSQADLIRNFLLMSAKEQDHLYHRYWKPLYDLLGKDNIEEFMFDYLMYKTQKKLKYEHIYSVFAETFKQLGLTRVEVMDELLRLGEIYQSFIFPTLKYQKRISNVLKSLKRLDQTTVYPFLLRVFDDYHSKIIDEQGLIKILNFLLNYHVRRLIVGSTSNSLRGLYITLYSRIFKIEENKENYFDSIVTFMHELKSRDEFPSDAQVLKNLKSIEIYKQRKFVKFLLLAIENHESNEQLESDTLSVEHIMPQTLQPAWTKMLGKDYERIHDEYLHTLGNLSLTGYNAKMSNKSFKEKQETLEKHSKAVELNRDVINQEVWTDLEIKQRAERLSEIVLTIFKSPTYESKNIRFENVEEHDLNYEREDITGKELYSYKFINMDHEIKVDTYRGMLIGIIEHLDSFNSNLMDDIARNLFNPWDEGKNDQLVNKSMLENAKYQTKIRDDLYLVGGFSAVGCIESIKKLMKTYQIDDNNFVFYTKVQ